MKAIMVSQAGDASVLKYVDNAPIPKPSKGEILVKIHAAGVNYVDIYHRRGYYRLDLPFIAGQEASGVVEWLGEGVSGFSPGDRVCYTGIPGSYSEYTVVSADRLIKLDQQISFIKGAAIPLQGMTAHYLTHDYLTIKPGHKVLVHAAAGGVGLLVVQMAKHMGAEVIGTVSTKEKAEIARGSGVDHTILYTQKDFAEETMKLTAGKGADLIIDGVGKSTFEGDLKAVATNGHIVIFGASSGPADAIVPNALMPRSIHLSGGMLWNATSTHTELMRRSSEVLAGIKEGWLKLRIGQVFPLEKATDAHLLLEERRSTGKLVLSVVD
jgi:NADPH2:quinone reductase